MAHKVLHQRKLLLMERVIATSPYYCVQCLGNRVLNVLKTIKLNHTSTWDEGGDWHIEPLLGQWAVRSRLEREDGTQDETVSCFLTSTSCP